MTHQADRDTSSDSLTVQEELAHLLKGVEETCKHARSILFALTTTSAFVLIAALSDSEEGAIELPLVGNAIPQGQFFVWGPLLVLALYLYLQVYVQELRGRFDRLCAFQARLTSAVPRDLLFPWLLVIALESERQQRERAASSGPLSNADSLGRAAPITALPVPYLYPLAVAIVWLLGPLVLAVLLLEYLQEEKAVAIVPCGAFVVAGWVAVVSVRRNRSWVESSAWGLAGAAVVMVTLASVPDLRERTYLAAIWGFRHTVAQWVRETALPLLSRAFVFTFPPIAGYAIVWLVHRRVNPVRGYRRRFAAALGQELRAFSPLHGRLRSQPDVDVAGLSLLDRAHTALILGSPGSGKSTLLKQLGLRIASNASLGRALVPVFVRLMRAGGSVDDLTELVITTLAEFSFPNPEKSFYRRAAEGKIVFLLDGLDEVPSKSRPGVIAGIQKLAARFPSCRMYITSRDIGYQGELDQTLQDCFRLSALSPSETKDLIQQRFGYDPDRASQLFERLNELIPLDLSRDPLIVTLAAEVLDRSGQLPRSAAELMDRIVHVRLAEWDRARNVVSFFGASEKAMLLKRLAQQLGGRSNEMSRSEANEIAKSVATDLGVDDQGEELLVETMRSGLIEESDERRIRFIHSDIQAYFTSRETDKNG